MLFNVFFTSFFPGPFLRQSLKSFVVGHWSVSRQVTTRHLAITGSPDNLITVSHAPDQPLPDSAFTWLVEHLSREGDIVIDVDSPSGTTFVSALIMKGGRSAVWISSASTDMQNQLEIKVKNIFGLACDNSSSHNSSDETLVSQ